MKVYKNLMAELKKREHLHFTLIDPQKQSPEKAFELAKFSRESGTTAIMIGGSTPVEKSILDKTVRAVKKVKLPVILFPSSIGFLSKDADAVFFLSLLNSRNPKFIIREPAKGAPIIKKLNIEAISVGYIVVEPGMKVGEVGQADLVKENEISLAIEYALAAQLFGFKLVYLEAGSGSPQPVSSEMISEVKNQLDIPLMVGGGIRGAKTAKEKIKAGADIIVTGNITEERRPTKLQRIISVVRPKETENKKRSK